MNKGNYIVVKGGQEYKTRDFVSTTFYTYDRDNPFFEFNEAIKPNLSYYSKGTNSQGESVWIKLIEK